MRGPGSYLVGILEAVVFHNLRKWKKCHSVMSDSATPWTITYQVPLSMGFSRQEYWSGLPFPSPRDLPDPGIEPRSSALQADALPSEPPGKPISTLTATQSTSS